MNPNEDLKVLGLTWGTNSLEWAIHSSPVGNDGLRYKHNMWTHSFFLLFISLEIYLEKMCPNIQYRQRKHKKETEVICLPKLVARQSQ